MQAPCSLPSQPGLGTRPIFPLAFLGIGTAGGDRMHIPKTPSPMAERPVGHSGLHLCHRPAQPAHQAGPAERVCGMLSSEKAPFRRSKSSRERFKPQRAERTTAPQRALGPSGVHILGRGPSLRNAEIPGEMRHLERLPEILDTSCEPGTSPRNTAHSRVTACFTRVTVPSSHATRLVPHSGSGEGPGLYFPHRLEENEADSCSSRTRL